MHVSQKQKKVYICKIQVALPSTMINDFNDGR